MTVAGDGCWPSDLAAETGARRRAGTPLPASGGQARAGECCRPARGPAGIAGPRLPAGDPLDSDFNEQQTCYSMQSTVRAAAASRSPGARLPLRE